MMIMMIPMIFCLLACSFNAAADPLVFACYGGNYTEKSAFRSSLGLLLNTLSSSNATFFTDAKGSIPDKAYGLFLCRGDAGPTDCRACVQNAAQDVVSLCPVSKQAAVWYDNCQLRYADFSFFSIVNESHHSILINVNNATDVGPFVKLETRLLDEVAYAVAYNSTLMFATGIAINGSGSPTMYALAQCTRDLYAAACSRCLYQIRAFYIYEMSRGGRFLGKSCNFRYESYLFFTGQPTVSLDQSAPPRPPPSPPPAPPLPASAGTTNTTSSNVVPIIVIPVVVVGAAAFVLVAGICFWRRSRLVGKVPAVGLGATMEDFSSSECLSFNLSVLKAATDNFSDSKKLGQGGFGTVYKGTFASGEDVAVKRLSASSRQGIGELKNELILVAKLQHKNLVRLRGVCLEEDENLLVYEYVPNGSLDNFLFDPAKCKQLNWEIRLKIVRGIAQGLLYLHEESHLKVIHRDLKASNVLLDSHMIPKISDFGMARLFAMDETHHITSHIVGTFGYMAPEYARRGHFSMKLDVYSFGVLVLEILTGRRSIGFQYDSEISQDILSYTWEHWRSGTALEIIDPSMGENFSSDEVLRCIQIALLCTQDVPTERPPMSSVFLMLHGPSTSFLEPLQPRFAGGMIGTGSLTRSPTDPS